MKSLRLIFLLAVAATGACTETGPEAQAPQGALARYVGAPDPSYEWSIAGRTSVDGTELLEMRLHSQTWHATEWKHRMFVLRPAHVATGSHALLILTGGRWRPAYEEPQESPSLPDDADVFFGIAEALETVVVVLDEVPFQPLFDLTEDKLIAYTLEQFLETGDETWPLLLPMVKSAVRGMDAAEEAARDELGLELASFTVLGGSKRGWAAWLTAAVDRRVTAVVPIVIDALNMERHFPHQTEVWGRPSDKIRPYTERNLHNILSSAEGRELREIIDPYAYRESLTQPKLIVNATNDEYFPLDSVNLYWDGLLEPKYALYLPNDGHSIKGLERLIPTLAAFHRAAAGLNAMPEVDWEYELEGGRVKLCVAGGPAFEGASVWSAESADRDFRDETWHQQALAHGDGAYRYERAAPDDHYLGIFAELEFALGDDTYTLSTTPAVVGPASAARPVWSAVSQGHVCDSAS
jgi:PhoPQ-activated pathogenicity-related protein